MGHAQRTQDAGALIGEAAQLLSEAQAPPYIIDILLDALREIADLHPDDSVLSE